VPPVARPYSGMYSPVMTFTSLMISIETGEPIVPKATSLTEIPSIT
jgi:hypothetical protein